MPEACACSDVPGIRLLRGWHRRGPPAGWIRQATPVYFSAILFQRQKSVEMKIRPKPSIVVFAKSVPQLAKFYREVGELTTVHEDKDHIVLEQESFQVVIHGVPPEISAQIRITVPPQIREEAPMKMCLPVESIGRARLKAAEHGGALGPRDTEWEARGFRACDGYDPEGNVFQTRESAA